MMQSVESRAALKRNMLPLPALCWFLDSTLKMGAACPSETVDIQQTTWRYIPEDSEPKILHPPYS